MGNSFVCPKCGRPLAGVSLHFFPTHWLCAECSGELEDASRSRLNDRVRFDFPDAGYESDQADARKYLRKGRIYRVANVDVYDDITKLTLFGNKDVQFNSVLFKRLQ